MMAKHVKRFSDLPVKVKRKKKRKKKKTVGGVHPWRREAMNEEQKRLVAELAGTECRCGETKKAKQTFCRKCFFKLPRDLRNALYQRIGQGYEQAYQAAVEKIEGGQSGSEV